MNLHLQMTVSELLTAHPSAMGVFLKRKMLCLGCPAESFHTLEEAARINGMTPEQLLKDLQCTIGDSEAGSSK